MIGMSSRIVPRAQIVSLRYKLASWHEDFSLIFWKHFLKKSVNNIRHSEEDRDRIPPYDIYTISGKQVMRIKKNINYGITN